MLQALVRTSVAKSVRNMPVWIQQTTKARLDVHSDVRSMVLITSDHCGMLRCQCQAERVAPGYARLKYGNWCPRGHHR
jgi:hypothetical protein